MNKQQALDYLIEIFELVICIDLIESLPEQLSPKTTSLMGENTLKKYSVNVMDSGLSANKIDIELKRNFTLLVKNEGTETEEAFWEDDEPKSILKKDISISNGNAAERYAAFVNRELRERVFGLLLVRFAEIVNEPTETEFHALRLKIAADGLTNQSKYIDAFMAQIMYDPDVREAGFTVTDEKMSTIIADSYLKVVQLFNLG